MNKLKTFLRGNDISNKDYRDAHNEYYGTTISSARVAEIVCRGIKQWGKAQSVCDVLIFMGVNCSPSDVMG